MEYFQSIEYSPSPQTLLTADGLFCLQFSGCEASPLPLYHKSFSSLSSALLALSLHPNHYHPLAPPYFLFPSAYEQCKTSHLNTFMDITDSFWRSIFHVFGMWKCGIKEMAQI